MADPVSFRQEAGALQPLLEQRPLIRTVNFHNTPKTRAAEYERQLAAYSAAFSPVNEDDLDQYLIRGHWQKPKPGLIVALYNGYRDNYDVFLPLLERYGFIGWFFVATTFVSTPTAAQPAFIALRKLRIVANEYADGRYALSWNEIKQLDRKHVIASHTRNHSQLISEDPSALEGEIIGSQRDLERNLGHPVSAFASLSGAPYGEYATADRLIEAAGYRFVFSNLKIQRLDASLKGTPEPK